MLARPSPPTITSHATQQLRFTDPNFDTEYYAAIDTILIKRSIFIALIDRSSHIDHLNDQRSLHGKGGGNLINAPDNEFSTTGKSRLDRVFFPPLDFSKNRHLQSLDISNRYMIYSCRVRGTGSIQRLLLASKKKKSTIFTCDTVDEKSFLPR